MFSSAGQFQLCLGFCWMGGFPCSEWCWLEIWYCQVVFFSSTSPNGQVLMARFTFYLSAPIAEPKSWYGCKKNFFFPNKWLCRAVFSWHCVEPGGQEQGSEVEVGALPTEIPAPRLCCPAARGCQDYISGMAPGSNSCSSTSFPVS